MKTYATAEDVAASVGVKPSTIRRWAREGRIPFMRLTARVLRFNPQAVDRALTQLAKRERETTASA